jgi:hypothetical protein
MHHGLAAPGPTTTAAVRRLWDREGLRAGPLLGVSRGTLDRLRGGLPIRRASLIVAVQALAAIDPEVSR